MDGELFSKKGAPIDWGSVKAIDVQRLIKHQEVENLEDLYDMLIKCTIPQTSTRKDILQAFEVMQLLLELKGGDAEDFKAQLDEQRHTTGLTSGGNNMGGTGAQRRMQQLELEIKHKSESLVTAEEQMETMASELQSARDTIGQRENEIQGLRDQLDNVSKRQQNSTMSADIADRQKSELVSVLKRKDGEVILLKEEVQRLKEKGNDDKKQIVALTLDSKKGAETIATLRGSLDGLRIELTRCEGDLQQAVTDRNAALAHVEMLSTHAEENTKVDAQILQHVDTTVAKWKNILGEKDAELVAAKEVIAQLQRECAQTRHAADLEIESNKRFHREQLAKMASELETAKLSHTAEERHRTSLMSSIHETSMSNLEDTTHNLRHSQRNVAELRSKLRKYEEGYGLSDAVSEIKALQDRVEEQKRTITGQTQLTNEHIKQINDLLDENAVLRERFGVTAVASTTVQRLRQEREKVISTLTEENKHLRHQMKSLQTDNEDAHQQQQRRRPTPGGIILSDKRALAAAEVDVSDLREQVRVLEATNKHIFTQMQQLTTSGATRMSELREAESNTNTLNREISLLRGALRQLAMQIQGVQYAVGSGGELQEYTIHSPESDKLVAFYNNQLQRVGSRVGNQNSFQRYTEEFNMRHGQQANDLANGEVDVEESDDDDASSSDEGNNNGKRRNDNTTPTTTAKNAPYKIKNKRHKDQGEAMHDGGLFCVNELVSMYQSDIMALRSEKLSLQTSLKVSSEKLSAAQVQIETLSAVRGHLERKVTNLEEVNASLSNADPSVGFPSHLPPTAALTIETLTRKLVEVMHEADVKQQHIISTQHVMEELERKYSLLEKQKSVIQTAQSETRKEYERELEQRRQEVVLMGALKEENKQWKMQLDNATQIFKNTHGSDETARLLGSVTRKLALAKVNNIALERRFRLLEQQYESASASAQTLREGSITREAETARHAVQLEQTISSLTNELHACTKQLGESVPVDQADALQRRCTSLAERYRNLLDKYTFTQHELAEKRDTSIKLAKAENLITLYQHEMTVLEKKVGKPSATPLQENPSVVSDNVSDVVSSRIEDFKQRADLLELQKVQAEDMLKRMTDRADSLDSKLGEVVEENIALKEKEAELKSAMSSRMHVDEAQKIRDEIAKLTSQAMKSDAEVLALKKTSSIAVAQADSMAKISAAYEKEISSLREQLVLLQTRDDEHMQLATLHHKLLSAQMREAEILREYHMERRKVLMLSRDVEELRKETSDQRKALIDQSRLGRSRFTHIHASLLATRAQYAGAVTLSEQERRVHAFEDVLQLKTNIENELEQVKKRRDEAENEVDTLKVTHEQYQKLIGALGGGGGGLELQVREWRQHNAHARITALKLQRDLSEEKEKVASLNKILDSSRNAQARLEKEAVQITQAFEERECAWFAREEELERVCMELRDKVGDAMYDITRKKLREKHTRQTSIYLPDETWPIGRRLEHALHSISELLEEKEKMNVVIDDFKLKVNNHDLSIAELKAKLYQAQASHLSDTNDQAGYQKSGGNEKLSRMEVQYNLMAETAQKTISSMQEMLDERDLALDSTHAYMETHHTQHMIIVDSLNREISDLKNMLEASRSSEQQSRGERIKSGRRGSDPSHEVIASLHKQQRELLCENEVLRVRAQSCEERLSEKDKEINELKGSMLENIESVEGDVRSVVAERDALKREVKILEQSTKQLEMSVEAQRTESEKQLEALSHKLESAQRKIDDLSRPGQPNVTMAQLREKLATSESTVNQLRASIQAVQDPSSSSSTLKQAMEPLVAERLRELEKENSSLQKELSAIRTRVHSAKDSQSHATFMLEKFKEENEGQRKELAAAQAIALKFEKDAKRVSKELENSKRRVDTIQRDLDSSRQARKKLQEQIHILQAKQDTCDQPKKESTQIAAQFKDESSRKWVMDKKMQKRLEAAKEKLEAAEKKGNESASQVESLKQIVERLTRERNALRKKNKAYEASAAAVEEVASLRELLSSVTQERNDLKQALDSSTKGGENVAKLHSEIKSLKQSLAVAKRKDLKKSDNELKKENIDLKAKNLQLSLQMEQFRSLDVESVKKENETLKKKLSERKSPSQSLPSTDAKKAAVAASEVDRMKVVVRTVRNENEKLKQDVSELEARVSSLDIECNTKEKQLQEEVAFKEELQTRIEELARNEEHLSSRVTELVSDNEALTSELEAFDPEFFEEIESLKYEHAQAVEEVRTLKAKLEQLQDGSESGQSNHVNSADSINAKVNHSNNSNDEDI
eukprot:m.113381 g.113381  ORF g.113381 m.113381 type:complete len:2269 (-) comp9264_c0_seq3:798-7604(-)